MKRRVSEIEDASSELPSSSVIVNCRGTRFIVGKTTLLRLGQCYLEAQVGIETKEEIFLDFSVAAFQALLDALTVSQVCIRKALLHISRSKTIIPDLEALLRFTGLEWLSGISLPLPPPPAGGMPQGDVSVNSRQNISFDLAVAFHRTGGVFHYLVKKAWAAELSNPASYQGHWNVPLPLPCRYDTYTDADVPLDNGEAYVEPASTPDNACIPVSIEMDIFNISREDPNNDDAFNEWLDDQYGKFSSIYMLGGLASRHGQAVKMHAGSAAVLDLGPRRVLNCDGLVIGVSKTQAHDLTGCHDILTVTTISDLDASNDPLEMWDYHPKGHPVLCQKLAFQEQLVTFFHLPVPKDNQRLGRMFRLTFDPFEVEAEDYNDIESKALYELHCVELFGDFLELPAWLVPDEQVRQAFVMSPLNHILRTRRRHKIPTGT